jgi:hypothetical protein
MISDQRRKALMQYGGACQCCGIDELDVLEIDHRDGGGNAHRRAIAPQTFLAWLQAHEYPDGFHLLCRPCHHSKTQHGVCMLEHDEDLNQESREAIPADPVSSRGPSSRRRAGGASPKQADELVALNTRISKEKKAWLEQQADARGVTLGRIIEDLMADQSQTLHEIKVMVTTLLSMSTPTPAMGDHDQSPPETREEAQRREYPHLYEIPKEPAAAQPSPPVFDPLPPRRRWPWQR